MLGVPPAVMLSSISDETVNATLSLDTPVFTSESSGGFEEADRWAFIEAKELDHDDAKKILSVFLNWPGWSSVDTIDVVALLNEAKRTDATLEMMAEAIRNLGQDPA